MNLPVPTEQQVEEFRKIYEQEYGTRLTYDEAEDAATRVLQLFYIARYHSKTPSET